MKRSRGDIAPGQLPLPFMAPVTINSQPVRRVQVAPYAEGPLLRTLRTLQRWQRRPVVATALAEHLGISERTTRMYLLQLEQAGKVERPRGPRSGWMVVR